MSRSGVNLAVTEDGATYNKLARPTDFLDSLSSKRPPPLVKSTAVSTKPRTPESNKRKLEDVEGGESGSESEASVKRVKASKEQKELWIRRKRDTTINRRMDTSSMMQIQFPGLDGAGNTSDEDTSEALAYLRSVRAEASTIPHTLIAPTQEVDDEKKIDRTIYNQGDGTILYEDGTFIARDIDESGDLAMKRANASHKMHAQEQHYRQIMKRYLRLRDKLALATPGALVNRRKKYPDTLKGEFVPTSMRDWRDILDCEYPTPIVVCQLTGENILNGIDVCARSLDHFGVISRQRSCWIWTLLAKAEEVGSMDYIAVGRIRDLGHKAGQFSIRLRNGGVPRRDSDDEDEEPEGWEADDKEDEVGASDSSEDPTSDNEKSDSPILDEQQLEGNSKAKDNDNTSKEAAVDVAHSQSGSDMCMSEDGEIGDDEPAEDLEAARARLLARLEGNSDLLASNGSPAAKSKKAKLPEPEVVATPDLAWNTMVTVDTIITIVGECYGQKDLLRFRNSWEK